MKAEMAVILLADALVILHLAFVAFVMGGGFLLSRWPKLAWLHLPSAAWGAYIEFSGGICPLTPLENRLRMLGGDGTYRGGFVEHYLLPILYPENLTSPVQLVLGAIVVGVNLTAYVLACTVWRSRREKGQAVRNNGLG
jgi:multisubunit Na+/H+ antiporter MnhC subunit